MRLAAFAHQSSVLRDHEIHGAVVKGGLLSIVLEMELKKRRPVVELVPCYQLCGHAVREEPVRVAVAVTSKVPRILPRPRRPEPRQCVAVEPPGETRVPNPAKRFPVLQAKDERGRREHEHMRQENRAGDHHRPVAGK